MLALRHLGVGMPDFGRWEPGVKYEVLAPRRLGVGILEFGH